MTFEIISAYEFQYRFVFQDHRYLFWHSDDWLRRLLQPKSEKGETSSGNCTQEEGEDGIVRMEGEWGGVSGVDRST